VLLGGIVDPTNAASAVVRQCPQGLVPLFKQLARHREACRNSTEDDLEPQEMVTCLSEVYQSCFSLVNRLSMVPCIASSVHRKPARWLACSPLLPSTASGLALGFRGTGTNRWIHRIRSDWDSCRTRSLRCTRVDLLMEGLVVASSVPSGIFAVVVEGGHRGWRSMYREDWAGIQFAPSCSAILLQWVALWTLRNAVWTDGP